MKNHKKGNQNPLFNEMTGLATELGLLYEQGFLLERIYSATQKKPRLKNKLVLVYCVVATQYCWLRYLEYH